MSSRTPRRAVGVGAVALIAFIVLIIAAIYGYAAIFYGYV